MVNVGLRLCFYCVQGKFSARPLLFIKQRCTLSPYRGFALLDGTWPSPIYSATKLYKSYLRCLELGRMSLACIDNHFSQCGDIPADQG
jgi:hypothetical protein